MLPRSVLAAAVLGLVTVPALAHPGHAGDAHSFAAGVAHPLLGIDHVLAMVTVGLWAALLGGRAVWRVPAAFVLSMVGGFALAMAGIGLPAVEPGIAASVFVLGILVAAAVRLPLAPSVLLVGLFAVLHGYSHGAGVSGGGLAFALGFVVATALLHAVGIGLGHVLGGQRPMLVRGLGGAVAATGLLLLGS
ncbi:MAG: HupE/UreJ family protein, partial [Gammaproteobacteria bacterium]